MSILWPLLALPFFALFAFGTFWNLAASLAADAAGGADTAAFELPGMIAAGGALVALGFDLPLLLPASSAALRLHATQLSQDCSASNVLTRAPMPQMSSGRASAAPRLLPTYIASKQLLQNPDKLQTCFCLPDEFSGECRDIPIALNINQATFYHLAIAGHVHEHIQQHTGVINAALGEAPDLLCSP